MGKFQRVLLFSVVVLLFNIMVFSDHMLGLDLFGAGLGSFLAGAATVIGSVIVWVVGTLRIALERTKPMILEKIHSPQDYAKVLMQYRRRNAFTREIDTMISQIKRMEHKNKTLTDFLLQHFDSHELTYTRFQGVITDGQHLFYANTMNVLNTLKAFDTNDYLQLTRSGPQKLPKEMVAGKMQIYNEYIATVREAVADNEQVLMKFDQMLLETTKLSIPSTGRLAEESVLQELDTIIGSIKWYKQQ